MPDPTPTGPPGDTSRYASMYQIGYDAGYDHSREDFYSKNGGKSQNDRSIKYQPPPVENITQRYKKAFDDGYLAGKIDAERDFTFEQPK